MPVAFYAAWLPRSFTLNALVNITAASPSDICAFGDYLSSSSEKTIHPVDWGAAGVFQKCFLLLRRARETNYHLISARLHPNQENPHIMSKMTLTGFALLSVLFFGNSSENYAVQPRQNASDGSTGTLQKMIVENGSVTLNVDLNGLNGSNALVTRPVALQFAAATNSFFSILVFNDQLRGAESGSIALVPQGRPVSLLPSLLAASLKQLVVEKLPADSAFDMAVRDAKTGFTFFKIEGHQYDYDARRQLLDVQDGRLLMSKEFAAALGRPADANSAVGKISISARMQPIEVTQLVNGEPKSMVMPALLHVPNPGTTPGPDVIVGDLPRRAAVWQCRHAGRCCSSNNFLQRWEPEDLDWFALPQTDHPVIPQNLYRMSGGADNTDGSNKLASPGLNMRSQH